MKYFLFLSCIILFFSCNVSDPPADQDQDLNQSLQKGKPIKVDICHLDEEGNYKKISVPEKVIPLHLSHGDGYPGDIVPDKPGYIFQLNPCC